MSSFQANNLSRKALHCLGLALLTTAMLASLAASAAAAGPALSVHEDYPEAVGPGVTARILVVVQNAGDAPFTGELTLADTFPSTLGIADSSANIGFTDLTPSCTTVAQTDSCSVPVDGLQPEGQVYFTIFTPVAPDAAGTFANTIEVTGGGAPQDFVHQEQMAVGPGDPFAFHSFQPLLSEADGAPATRAGSDPAEIATSLSFPTVASDLLGVFAETVPVEQFKDVVAHLPAGLIGNTQATPVRCTSPQLTNPSPEAGHGEIPQCPLDSQVGVVRIAKSDIVPLYNMVAPIGSPAAFGFQYQSVPVVLRARVRPGDSGIDIVALDASSSVPIPSVEVTFWGVPSDSSHDRLRGLCLDGLTGNNGNTCPTSVPRTAFLRLPTSCPGTPLAWSADANSFPHPERTVHIDTSSPATTDCEAVPFSPTLKLTPSNPAQHEPTGLDAELTLPQGATPEGIDESDLQTVTTTLPPGLTIDPSSADGLQACTDAQLGLGVEGASSCPDASKLGTVTLSTPLLDHPLPGSIWLRTQSSNDPASGELFRIAIEIRSDDDGIDLKLPGALEADPTTGRLTTVFENLPQLPFSTMRLHFKSGPRAALALSSACGEYTTHSLLGSWSGKTMSSDSSFEVSGDGKGGPCAPPAFSPGFAAGDTSPVAGAFAPFGLRLTRSDADGELQSLSSLKLPPGLLADIGSVAARCTVEQADAHACPAASHIGEVTVGAGAGPDPYYVNGDVYLMGGFSSGPFAGDPFGLAVIVRAAAGPFDLGYVVVKNGIQVHDDGSISAQSEPFPTILQGVPLRVRDIRVNLDRPGFMLSPTNCDPLSIAGTVASTDGQSANVSNGFQAGECANLRFHPSFKASTQGNGRLNRNGASLDVKIAMKSGPAVPAPKREANISKVEVRLPFALPSRLTTLQKACTSAQFATNPAGCPAASKVGTAIAKTPILATPLTGPAYLVSHGGNAFPDLVTVLQSEGVTIHLTGNTDIKNGYTYSRFRTVPDAPVSSFELKLPEGQFSALAANKPLCKAKLSMPTTITGQNGAVYKQSTKIAVSGCPKAHKTAKKRAHGKRKKA
jgi:hypothetical protein